MAGTAGLGTVQHMALILIDQDGVLANFDKAVDNVLAAHGYDPAELQRTEWETTNDVARVFGEDAARLIDDARWSSGFYRNLEVVEGAVEGVENLLRGGNRVVVCTAPSLENQTCASEKIAWIAEHFPDLRKSFVVCKDKTLVRGHVLVDDKPDVSGDSTPLWEHMLFRTRGNAHVTHEHLVDGWAEWEKVANMATARERAHPRYW